jgi:aromatic ring-opening dioxygenase catalytic subunit (LigB family)
MELRFICVLDFEATCDNGRVRINGRPVEHEIIEFPSVLYELDYGSGGNAVTATKIAELEQNRNT